MPPALFEITIILLFAASCETALRPMAPGDAPVIATCDQDAAPPRPLALESCHKSVCNPLVVLPPYTVIVFVAAV